jgi:murein DD-endopeptidase MepM/ murein hydrolase activator NlpD
MDKHFSITIHDDNGVKVYNIHKLVKKIFYYALAFIVTLFVVAITTILYLDKNLDTLEHKKEVVQQNYQYLQKQMTQTQKSLEKKKKELSELSDSLSEIETLIGLKPLEDSSLQKRLTVTKLTSNQRATLLRFIPSGSPIQYNGITSKFGYRIHPTLHKKEFHRGSDMKAKYNTPVYAPADGIVEWAGYHKRSGFGYLVILQHMYGFKTYYGHLKKVAVKSGEFVKKGDLIAYTGNSGLSNGPHLHYEIRYLQRPLNPFYFIKWTQKNYNQIFEKEKKVPWKTLLDAFSQIQIALPPRVQEECKQFINTQEKHDTNSSL